ncbi:hypothetical protein VI817_007878 [Penicillium citrinum]|nr:hypothetical protein VI817_007878 [Penicillium citrinum]
MFPLPIDPPSLYLGIEGEKIGRLCSISISSLHVPPLVNTYLIDFHVLGENTFDVKDIHGSSLRGVLEDSLVPKAVSDIRSVSLALYSHFEFCVNGVIALQLLELATRDYSLEYLAGLSKRLLNDAPLNSCQK